MGHRMKTIILVVHCCGLVTQSCPTLRDPMDCSLPGSFVRGIFTGLIIRVGYHFFRRGIFQAQGSIPYLSVYHITDGLFYCWATAKAVSSALI